MSGRIDKEFRPVVKRLRGIDGIEIAPPRGGNNHYRVLYHGRRVASLPTSSSCSNATRSLLRQLRQHGVPV